VYSFWQRYGTANAASRSGFSGKLGSIGNTLFGGINQPYFSRFRSTTVKYLYQYDSTPIQEAGVADGANWTTAATALDWGDTGAVAANVSVQTSLNLAAIRYKKGIYYKIDTTIQTTSSSELTF
jgi:hypothetical protein